MFQKLNMHLRICVLALLLLPMAASLHQCAKVRRTEPTFDPDKLEEERNFKNFLEGASERPMEWPLNDVEEAAVVTFTLRAVEEQPHPDLRAIVQIAMTDRDPMGGSASYRGLLDEMVAAADDGVRSDSAGELGRALLEDAGGGLFNCHVDRSGDNPCPEGASNPRCCYHPNSSLGVLTQTYPACAPHDGCQRFGPGGAVIKKPCQVVCTRGMVLQVELGLNGNGTGGGRTSMTSVSRRTRLLQSDRADEYDFTRMATDDGDLPRYAEVVAAVGSSPLNGRTEVAFWMRWRPRQTDSATGPLLEVGREAEETPYLVHDFSKGAPGWWGTDMQDPLLLGTFRPKFWHVNGLASGGGEVEVGADCSNVIRSRFQDQVWLDGPCMEHAQCQRWCLEPGCRGRRCRPDRRHYGGDLGWLGMKTCQIEPILRMPGHIVAILVLVAIVGLALLVLLGLALLYLGTIRSRKKRAANATVMMPPGKKRRRHSRRNDNDSLLFPAPLRRELMMQDDGY